MKRKLILTFWFAGSTGAVLWTCFWLFGVIYTRKFHPTILVMFALGVFGAWEGFKMFREEKELAAVETGKMGEDTAQTCAMA